MTYCMPNSVQRCTPDKPQKPTSSMNTTNDAQEVFTRHSDAYCLQRLHAASRRPGAQLRPARQCPHIDVRNEWNFRPLAACRKPHRRKGSMYPLERLLRVLVPRCCRAEAPSGRPSGTSWDNATAHLDAGLAWPAMAGVLWGSVGLERSDGGEKLRSSRSSSLWSRAAAPAGRARVDRRRSLPRPRPGPPPRARAACSPGPRRSGCRCRSPVSAAIFFLSLQMKTSTIFCSGSSMPP